MVTSSYYKWFILSAMFLLIALINLDYTAVNMALVVISNDLEPDLGKLQWLLSGYVLAWAAFVIPAGRITDGWGQKKGLLLGVFFFTLASFVCGIAPDVKILIAGRVLQGIGGALFVPPLYALIMRIFNESQRGLAIGMLGVSAGVGLAIGPTFGGFITEWLGWRYVFFLMIPFGILSFAVFYKLIETDISSDASREKFDILGAFLLMGCLVSFMYGLNEIPHWGFYNPKTLGLLGVGITAFLIFLWRSSSEETPLIPTVIFKSKGYTVLTCLYLFTCLFFTLITVLFGLYLQNVKGLDPVTGSYYFIALTLTFAIISPFVGNIYNRFGGQTLITTSFSTLALGFFVATFLSPEAPVALVLFCLFICGVGLGIGFPAANTGMLKNADQTHLTTASAVFNMASTIGCTLGVIFGAASLVGISHCTICNTLTASHDLSTYLDELIVMSSSTGRDYSMFVNISLKDPVEAFLNEHFMNAFHIVMYIASAVAAICAGVAARYLTKAN